MRKEDGENNTSACCCTRAIKKLIIHAPPVQSMYIRIKRKKTTVFLHVEPTDTVLEVKQKLQELVEQVS